MNKIKVATIGERVEINLNFDSLDAARFFFSNEECIDDLMGALLTEDEAKEAEELKSKTDKAIASIAEVLKSADNNMLDLLNRTIQNELNKRK